jgi:NADH-quinone oxidoreductase subunit N
LYTSLQKIVTDIHWIYPELCLLSLLIFLLLADLTGKKKASFLLPIATISGFLLTIVFILAQRTSLFLEFPNGSGLFYNSFLKLDHFACYLKCLFCLAGILAVIFTLCSSDYKREEKGEFYYLLVSVVLGLQLLVMANNLLMVFISLEIISIGSYILTIFNFDKKGTESAIKYILFGAFCTGIMLFGISLLYGIYGNFDFPTLLSVSTLPKEGTIVLVAALFMTLTGLFFKISAFPFHVWTPDIYQGAPSPVVAFFSVAPKAGALAVLFKILFPLLLINSEVSGILTLLLSGIAIVTMTIGNFSALVQKNLRRMLAYSTIGHAGFLLMTVVCVKDLAVTALLFYLTVYLFMNFTAFVLVDVFAGKAGSVDVNNFKGLGLKMPFLGGIFVLTMIALTGLPPTAGFYAKLFVFSALWETYQVTGNQLFLVLLFFGLINTILSLFYYLRIPYFIYFKKDESGTILTSEPLLVYVFIILISLPLLILFFNPNWVLTVIGYIKL